jgi:hypothetical protein
MAYSLAELIYLSAEEVRVAERLPLDSPERKSMLARRLAEIRAENEQNERQENENRCCTKIKEKK